MINRPPDWRPFYTRHQTPSTPTTARFLVYTRETERHHDALTPSILIIKYMPAQCYPRHACPLHGSVLMQLPEMVGTLPALDVIVQNGRAQSMQNNALYCM